MAAADFICLGDDCLQKLHLLEVFRLLKSGKVKDSVVVFVFCEGMGNARSGLYDSFLSLTEAQV